MTLGGLMKLTLLDYPGRVACTVFTSGCNFHCPFCHNASLVNIPQGGGYKLEEEEFFSFIRKRLGILDGVCITGGEPTVMPDLTEFTRKIKDIGYKVKLDTNGSNPGKLFELIEKGLVDYVAMDIKNSPSKYELTAKCNADMLKRVCESVTLLMNSEIDFEFRTTVVNELHTDSDFHEIGEWIKGAPRYYLQSFKDSGDILEGGYSAPPDSDLKRYLTIIKKYIPGAKLRGTDGN